MHKELILLCGSYGAATEPTFHSFRFDENTGALTPLAAMSRLENPSFLTVTGDGDTVLAIGENNGNASVLYMLKRIADGKYSPATTRHIGADGPCHVAVSPNGRWAAIANYTSGSVSVIDFDVATGTIGEPAVYQFHGHGTHPTRQKSPHAHFTWFTADGKMMVVDDLGSDSLHTFRISSDGKPDFATHQQVSMKPGSGPRHAALSADGKTAYLLNEINGDIVRLNYDSAAQQIIAVDSVHADLQDGRGAADIHIHPNGKFLYASLRLNGDGIIVFSINDDGSLTRTSFTPTGIHPRNFIISPGGRWLIVAARDDNRLEVHGIDPKSGALSACAAKVQCPRPVCLQFTN